LVAACCVVNENYPQLFLPDKLWSLSYDDNVANPHYLDYLFKHEGFRDKFRNNASGGHDSMLNISMKKFLEVLMPLPPLSLQNKFAIAVKKSASLRMEYSKSTNELNSLYGSLCQQAFKEELDLSGILISHVKKKVVDTMIQEQSEVESKKLSFSNENIKSLIIKMEGEEITFEDLLEKIELEIDMDTEDENSNIHTSNYDKVKDLIFYMMGEKDPIITQVFDESTKKITLRVKKCD
jgi:type I restriction enzyme S subunit